MLLPHIGGACSTIMNEGEQCDLSINLPYLRKSESQCIGVQLKTTISQRNTKLKELLLFDLIHFILFNVCFLFLLSLYQLLSAFLMTIYFQIYAVGLHQDVYLGCYQFTLSYGVLQLVSCSLVFYRSLSIIIMKSKRLKLSLCFSHFP